MTSEGLELEAREDDPKLEEEEVEPFTQAWLESKQKNWFWNLIRGIQKVRRYVFLTVTDHSFSRLVQIYAFFCVIIGFHRPPL